MYFGRLRGGGWGAGMSELLTWPSRCARQGRQHAKTWHSATETHTSRPNRPRFDGDATPWRANQECRRRHLKEDGKSGIPLMDGYDTRNSNLNKCWQFLFVWKQQGTKSDLMSDSETTDTAKDITWISWSIFGVFGKNLCQSLLFISWKEFLMPVRNCLKMKKNTLKDVFNWKEKKG